MRKVESIHIVKTTVKGRDTLIKYAFFSYYKRGELMKICLLYIFKEFKLKKATLQI